MARVRSDKSKKTPLDKPLDRKKKMTTGQSDEASTSAEPSGRDISETPAQQPSLQSTTRSTRSKNRQEPQRIEPQPSAGVRESEKFSERTVSTSTPNGQQGIEDDSATHRRIEERAYILFQESGCEHGNDWFHWFEAERQVKEPRV